MRWWRSRTNASTRRQWMQRWAAVGAFGIVAGHVITVSWPFVPEHVRTGKVLTLVGAGMVVVALIRSMRGRS